MSIKLLSSYFLGGIALISLFCCEEYEDDRLDFSNSLPQFVQLADDDTISASLGDTVAIEIELRERVYSDTNVAYEITGGISQSGTATIPSGGLGTLVILILPSGTPGEATVRLTSVDNGLSVGRPNVSSSLSAASRVIAWE